jgi:DNA-binding NarL/FixJ family response regulator
LPVATAKVVLIDDHEILRAGVRDLLDSLPGYEVVGETSTACAGLEIVESERPDIVLMDVGLPGMDGILATREILRRVPESRVVVLSAHKQPRDVVDAFNAGAVAYVLKEDPPETLLQALDDVVRGFRYVPPVLVARLVEIPTPGATGDNPSILLH